MTFRYFGTVASAMITDYRKLKTNNKQGECPVISSSHSISEHVSLKKAHPRFRNDLVNWKQVWSNFFFKLHVLCKNNNFTGQTITGPTAGQRPLLIQKRGEH